MQLVYINIIRPKSFQTSFACPNKTMRENCMKHNPQILIQFNSLTVCFDILGRHIASTGDFGCNHNLITSHFTIFYPVSNESLGVAFGCSITIRRNRILFRCINQVRPMFQDCLVLRDAKRERFISIWSQPKRSHSYEECTSAISLP
jgi:hypothetical protein